MSVKIIYKDMVPKGKEDIINIETSEINPELSHIDFLKRDSITPVHYATLEKNQWKLDGTYKGLTSANTAYWSTQVSNDEAVDEKYMFATSITLTRIFENKHTSVGLSFMFADPDYCNHLNIKWYNDDVVVNGENGTDFYPDKSEYYCKQNVDIFNKVEVTFYSMNKPNRFLKIFAIDDGVNRIFNDKDVYSITILSEMSLISEELFNHQLELSLKRTEDTEFIFQKRQPMFVYHNGSLEGQFFVESSERTSKNIYDIKLHNYTGILESNKFYGGIYKDVPVKSIVNDIFKGESIKVNISDDVSNTLLSGYIPITTKREALAQVLFASCSVCDTMRTDEFKIFKLQNNELNVPSSRIKQGGSLKTSDKVTKVTVWAHNYTLGTSSEEIYSGQVFAGLNTIEFGSPVNPESVTISGAVLVECYNNYCIISSNINAEIVITGRIYTDNTTSKELVDSDVILGTTTNEYEVTDATLVSASNIDAVLLNVFNHYKANSTLETDMIFENEKLGDNVILHTEWSGDKKGRLEQIEYDIRTRKIGKVVQRING